MSGIVIAGGRPRGRFVSPLAPLTGRAPANADEMWALRRRAWRESGVVVVRPEEIRDDAARRALVEAAKSMFGPRNDGDDARENAPDRNALDRNAKQRNAKERP